MRRSAIAMLSMSALVAACSGNGAHDQIQPLGVHQAGLSSVGVRPVPCGDRSWQGTAVDLMMADALTACSGDPTTKNTEPTFLPDGGGAMRDGYLTYLRGQMMASLALDVQPTNLFLQWADLRANKDNNCDPVTGEKTEATITPRYVEEYVTVPTFSVQYPSLRSRKRYANMQVRNPGFNLCVAQTLREMVPGASGGEALLLSDADQRMLLETIRERAQIAVLDYAMLGVAFSTAYGYTGAPPAGTTAKNYLADIQYWALTANGSHAAGNADNLTLKRMGGDFAAAVQLHATVSEELASLLARSAGARIARGGSPATRADEVWGAGSWHQRLLTAMLGGDPLANEQTGPWDRPDDGTFPQDSTDYPLDFAFSIPGPPAAAGYASGWDWPDIARAPYVKTNIGEPQVHELFRLARKFDRIMLRVSKSGGTCNGFDIKLSANDLYDWVEAHLRRQSCLDVDPMTQQCCTDATCGPVVAPVTGLAQEQYLLWQKYRIRRDHAGTLAQYLAENLDYDRLGLEPKPESFQASYCSLQFGASSDSRAGAQYTSGRVWFEANPSDAGIVWMRLSPLPGSANGMPLDPGFGDRPLEDIAPTYSRNAVLRSPQPWDLEPKAPAQLQGYIGSCSLLPASPACPEPALEAKRLMGATSALAATRFLIMGSIGNLKAQGLQWEKARLTDYFASAEDILKTIDGAIGAESVAVAPVAYKNGTQVSVKLVSGEPVWQVAVTSAPNDKDGFWREGAGPYKICAIEHPAIGNLVSQPASMPGLSLPSEVAKAEAANRCSTGMFWSQLGPEWKNLVSSYDGAPRGWTTFGLRLPVGQRTFSLVAVRTPAGAGESYYRLVGSTFAIGETNNLQQGQFIALSGTLGDTMHKAVLGKRNNPTEHAYDGFGLPSDWVPPFTAELIGGSSEQTSVDRYLALAKEAADGATVAVTQAIDGLQAEDQDQHTKAAATQRWQQGMTEELETLCGPVNKKCEVDPPVLVNLNASWFQHLASEPEVSCDITEEQHNKTCDDASDSCTSQCGSDCSTGPQCGQLCADPCKAACNATCESSWDCDEPWIGKPACDVCKQACPGTCAGQCETSCAQCVSVQDSCRNACKAQLNQCKSDGVRNQVDCYVWRLSQAVRATSAEIATPVVNRLDSDPTQPQPAFEEFSGGSLQSAMIEQWRAVRAIDERLLGLSLAASSAKARVAQANAALSDANEAQLHQCNPWRLLNAINDGESVTCSGDPKSRRDEAGWHCTGKTGSRSFSWGPYNAQRNACEDSAIGIGTAEAALLTSYADALASLGSATIGMTDALSTLASSGSNIAALLNQTRLAKSRLDLEKKLSVEGLQTSFGMWRRYRSYDVWRAKVLVENARRYALAARRAIEARYVLNLSNLSQPEAFVQSPATWADEVFEYDLSLPAAVGLSVGATAEQGGALYPNKVTDYIGNLQAFVMGYSVTRPAAVARQEIDIVNLKGLKLAAAQGEDVLEASPDLGEWSLHCAANASMGLQGYWTPVAQGMPASQLCQDSTPDRARLGFALDPWGRLNDSIANEPYSRRFNGRWGLLAVNFVGTGVKNCEAAKDPYTCYGEGFIRYSLSHAGPAWVTDYDGIWRELGVPIGRIEGAKALAAELWLDPLKDGWGSPYINAVARTELELRPLGGAYEMEFEIRPEINIDRIERVQILVGSTYWVKQD